ncbi:hypothetical protein JDV02_010115 [Purpureocillium takamizusanense]|uniref:Uncharacterized protein n=1 Tax=Purpureocillium takamizusanense TaxID=2060973 RepID=A0A9Q8VG79_9HYPO|nr:uncharacterized protein JDV02_010115 [Purpureocillium takamizusanense]UNI24363.1 hypothetical protein JDV02_010115 [Purpureocillium takamizusanense]
MTPPSSSAAAAMSPAAAVAARQERNDDAAERDNAADDGLEDAADAADDGHDAAANRLQGRSDLFVPSFPVSNDSGRGGNRAVSARPPAVGSFVLHTQERTPPMLAMWMWTGCV